jgi:CHAD domain-containing protein
MRVRLRKCITLLPRALSEDDPNVIHDLRVWSRRLQQVIVTIFPGTLPPEARTMIRALRQARRSLGGWRDCDVVIAILQRKLRHVRDPEQKQVWQMVLASARRALQKQMRRARRKIANRKMFTLAQKGEALLQREASTDGRPQLSSLDALQQSIVAAYQDWREALERAKGSDDAAEIHAFRIRSKRLRYRIELLRDLGSVSAQSALAGLKSLQDELGRWHDNLALTRVTAEALADPDFLMHHPVAVAGVLQNLDRDANRHLKRVRRLLVQMHEEADSSPLHAALSVLQKPPELQSEDQQEPMVQAAGQSS